MFLKQYNYKPRSGSVGSQGSNDAAAAAASAQQPAAASNTNEQGSVTAAAAGRRRSSAEKFSGLQGYKRSSIDDKKTSIADQQQQSGVLGQMWNNFTKGTGK